MVVAISVGPVGAPIPEIRLVGETVVVKRPNGAPIDVRLPGPMEPVPDIAVCSASVTP